jgi:hypothetical protein
MRRTTILIPALAGAALAASVLPASATTRRCDLVHVTLCATASGMITQSASCANPPAGAQSVCAEHSGTGYAFHITCSASGDGPAYVQVFGCEDQVAGGPLMATVGSTFWRWNSTSDLCYEVTSDAIFNSSVFVVVTDRACW